jgi:hypothetical protein
MWFVVVATASHGAPDAAYCQTVADLYGLTMPVLFDPSGATQNVLNMRANGGQLVMSQGNVIEMNGGPDHQAVESALETIFGF